MALIKCPDCGKMISDIAKTCIGCGRPMEEEDSLMSLIQKPSIRSEIQKLKDIVEDDSHMKKYLDPPPFYPFYFN